MATYQQLAEEKKKLLSVKELTNYIPLSEAAIWSLLHTRKLQSVKIGGRRFVRLEDIQRLLRQGNYRVPKS